MPGAVGGQRDTLDRGTTDRTDSAVGERVSDTGMSTLWWIVVSGFAMTAMALTGSLTLLRSQSALRRIPLPLVAFAAGALLGLGQWSIRSRRGLDRLARQPSIWRLTRETLELPPKANLADAGVPLSMNAPPLPRSGDVDDLAELTHHVIATDQLTTQQLLHVPQSV